VPALDGFHAHWSRLTPRMGLFAQSQIINPLGLGAAAGFPDPGSCVKEGVLGLEWVGINEKLLQSHGEMDCQARSIDSAVSRASR
jgi:hypothetical protein